MGVLRGAVFAVVVVGIVVVWQSTEAPRPMGAQDFGSPAQLAEDAPELVIPLPTGAISAVVEVPLLPANPQDVVVPILPASAQDVGTPILPASPQDVRVPILMYHRIDWLPYNAEALRKSLSIVPPDFDSQVRFLKDRGFTSVTLYDVYEALEGKRKLPSKPVALTFDDGYADNYANAFPVLKRYGFTGAFFVLTDLVGTGEYMNWDQLKEMLAGGMKIEVHGRTHADLTRLNAAGIDNQAKGGKDAIQNRLGVTPKFYCYPSGEYNKDVIDIVKANGYLAALTTNYGSDHSLEKAFELKRLRIDGRESFGVFARKVGENP